MAHSITGSILRFLLGSLCLLPLVAQAQTISVVVEIVDTRSGESGSVGVYCNSDIPLAGIRVPLVLDDPDITIDSVSFANSAAGTDFEHNSQLSNVTRRGFTNIVPKLVSYVPVFYPQDDELFRIHFHVRQNALPGLVVIDTFITRNQVGQLVWYDQMEASDEFGVVTLPEFAWGGIWIQDHLTDVNDDLTSLPETFTLSQNFPNPFNPTTAIPFSLPKAASVTFEVLDITGRTVSSIAARIYPAGNHSINFDGSQLSSGVYFYRLTTPFGSQTRKMTLIK